jgi:hypothetical protein
MTRNRKKIRNIIKVEKTRDKHIYLKLSFEYPMIAHAMRLPA